MKLADHPAFDRLLRALRRAPRAIPWKGSCFRVAEERWARSEDLFSGEGARRLGGRWNRPGTAAAYASLDPDVAAKEWLAQLKRAGIPPAQRMPAAWTTGDVELQRVLDVGDASLLEALGLSKPDLLDVDWEEDNRRNRESLPQALGRAALRCKYEALLVPSATGRGRNIVLFPRALRAGSRVKPKGLKGRYP